MDPKLPKQNSVHQKSEQPLPPPKVVSEDEWVVARKELLAEEKDILRAYDNMMKKRLQLPWRKVSDYTFSTPNGGTKTLKSLLDPNDGKALVVQHFMWPEGWEKGCSICASWTDNMSGIAPQLSEKCRIAVIMNAPSQEKFTEFVQWKKWDPYIEVLNAKGTTFGFDFHVSQSPEDIAAGKPMMYNFKEGPNLYGLSEHPGYSVFARQGDEVYHTYSTYGRGLEPLSAMYGIIDILPGGRQGYMASNHKEDIFAERNKK